LTENVCSVLMESWRSVSPSDVVGLQNFMRFVLWPLIQIVESYLYRTMRPLNDCATSVAAVVKIEVLMSNSVRLYGRVFLVAKG